MITLEVIKLPSARLPQLGTRTPVLSQYEHDLATALQTIIKIRDRQALKEAIEDAFSASRLEIKNMRIANL